MGEKSVRFSDLSGQMAENPEDLASMLVTEHPDLDKPVLLEALPEELAQLGKFGLQAVRVEVIMPGEDEATGHTLTVNNFNKLATGKPMSEVLADAQPAAPKRRSHNKTSNGDALRSFDTLEQAGLPHKGKVGEEEARLVREHLEAVNARRVAQGFEPIDPGSPIDAKRYGFTKSRPGEA
jgi:hypothetical protein